MSTSPARLKELIRSRLAHAGPHGRDEADLMGMAQRFVRGATEAEARAALAALAEAGEAVRVEDRWVGQAVPEPAMTEPVDAASLEALQSSGLRLPPLSAKVIELTIDGPEAPERPAADKATLEANFARIVAGVPVDASGRRNLGDGRELLDQLFEGVARSEGPPPPAPAQIAATAWLITNADRIPAAIADAFQERGEFAVQQVRVTEPVEGRSTLVLTGWCSWDPEHGFRIELDGDEVIAAGPA